MTTYKQVTNDVPYSLRQLADRIRQERIAESDRQADKAAQDTQTFTRR